MPKATVNSGASNAGAAAAEIGHAADLRPEPEPASDVVAVTESSPDLGAAAGQAPADYGSMSKGDLADEAKSRGLSASGTKAELAARLAGHDAAQAGDV